MTREKVVKMFAGLDEESREHALKFISALLSNDPHRVTWVKQVCSIIENTTGDARKVALLRVEDGLLWKQIAERTGFSVGQCRRLYDKAMKQLSGRA